MTFDEDRLTICTASFGHARHLAFNWELCRRLNGDRYTRIEWLVAENTPQGSTDRIDSISTASQFKVFPGSPNIDLGASYHHASALNSLLSKVTSRFVLVLDPDFYILRRNWMSDVIAHMQRRNLAFFGAPWHPRYTENYRYFPAVHCMFVDQVKVAVRNLDFRPILDTSGADSGPGGRGFHSRFDAICRRVGLGHRLRIPWDTGSRVYLRYASDPEVRTDCVIPVYRFDKEAEASGIRYGLTSRVLERVLPERLCYLPKRRDSYTTAGFKERGWIDLDLPWPWEEHIWRDVPFGLHMRRSFSARNRDAIGELKLCHDVVDLITSAS